MIKRHFLANILSVISLFLLVFLAFNAMFSRSAAQTARWIAPKDADNLKNPLVANRSVLAAGKALYTANCGPCHGDKGRGDGPAASGLNPRPADHTSGTVQNETDGSLFWKITEGRTPMPSYKKVFTDEQRWELVTYIRSLAKMAKKK
ncbi:cytochrome c class I [Niastella vici]|uniref:Cytochrome c class I n=1 Tax=Niastella vici TaxID=1703345 RepID=A0A1V9FQ87_9BACT|nr:c-type cytochrome [Niastella vici]OQP60539.1 cytochrome c class I [Niastella vici]